MNNELTIIRYPATKLNSLQAWNAADTYILNYLRDEKIKIDGLSISNDRFGYLAANLASHGPSQTLTYKSQEKAIRLNFGANNLELDDSKLVNPLEELKTPINVGLIKVPKSTELFGLYLDQICSVLSKDGIVVCGFMTKYFNKKILDMAGLFFEEVDQNLAWKKSRLLILKKKKNGVLFQKEHSISFEHDKTGSIQVQQYAGVFSSNNIDYATQFFIDHLKVEDIDQKVLDIGSGNGILSISAKALNKDAEIHLVDDSYLAIESSRLNLKDEKAHFHYNDTLDEIESDSMDLAISNPPFHFEFETNIEVPVNLFKQIHRCLRDGGKFKSVASKHLNFKTHLEPLFTSTKIIAENTKFVIYESVK